MRKIDEMLETAIEIEGLLRIIRDGEPGEETYELLRRKIGELSMGEIPERAVEMEEEADVRMEEAEKIEMKAAKEADNNAAREVEIEATRGIEEDEDKEDEDDIILSLDDDENESATADLEKKVKPTARNLRAGFSLNDRFLYARELFDNNMKTFDSTLKSLEGVEDFSVIEDYFYNELDWDRENPIVKEFMERINPSPALPVGGGSGALARKPQSE